MKIQFKKLNKESVFFIVLACLLAISIFFIYTPRRKKVIKLKTLLDKKEQSIENIQSVLETEGAKGILKIKKDYIKAKTLFPESSDKILKCISEEAHSLGIKIAQINPGDAELLLKDSKKVNVGGKNLYVMSVNMKIVCSYRDLAEYLKNLHLVCPALITTEKIRIEKESESAGTLRVNVNFMCYYKSK